MVRLDMRLDEPDVPQWQYCGGGYPYDLMRESWRAYRDHGVLFEAGGYMEQPPEWWDMIHTFEALYNTLWHKNMPEYEAKLEADRKQ